MDYLSDYSKGRFQVRRGRTASVARAPLFSLPILHLLAFPFKVRRPALS